MEPEVEQYLKTRILIAEPSAVFHYAPEFLAWREKNRTRTIEEVKAQVVYSGPRDIAGRPMSPRLIAYWQDRGYFPDYETPE